MKEDSFEDILRKKLQDYQSAEGCRTWQQMQRRMELYNNAHPELRPRNPIRRRILYGAAAVLFICCSWRGRLPIESQLDLLFDAKCGGTSVCLRFRYFDR